MKIAFEIETTPAGTTVNKVIAGGRPRGWIGQFGEAWLYSLTPDLKGAYWYVGEEPFSSTSWESAVESLLRKRPRFRERRLHG